KPPEVEPPLNLSVLKYTPDDSGSWSLAVSGRIPKNRPASAENLRPLDLLPVFGPIIAGKFQFSGMGDSGRWTRKDHEENEVYGGADRLHPAAGRGRHRGWRDLSQSGDQRGDLLQLAQQIWRPAAVRDEATASVRGRERL